MELDEATAGVDITGCIVCGLLLKSTPADAYDVRH